jgi:carboxyl-terminal processing protease
MQDHERAVIMGQTSFGKGSVQTLVSLPDGSGLKLTVARYFTPKDRSIQAKGIAPDIYVAGKKSAGDDDKPEKKESDLKGHIESKDLSNLSKESSIVKFTETWPQNLKQDYQLVTAFTYLKTWSIFQQGKPEAEKTKPQESGKPSSDEPIER